MLVKAVTFWLNIHSVPGINQTGNITTVDQISSTAVTGIFGHVGYVTRTGSNSEAGKVIITRLNAMNHHLLMGNMALDFGGKFSNGND